MAKAKKKLEAFDPFARKVITGVADWNSPAAHLAQVAQVEQLETEKHALIEALTKVLEVNRVRATLGFKPLICNACDQPHPGGECPPRLRGGKYQGECPHHNATRLLRSMGVELDPRMG